MMPYFELADKKRFTKHAVIISAASIPQIKKKQVIAAVEDAYMAQDEYYIDRSHRGSARHPLRRRARSIDVAVIAGRPYHVDPEINHGIDQLIASCSVWSSCPRMRSGSDRCTRGACAQSVDLPLAACTARRNTSPRRKRAAHPACILRLRHRRDHDRRDARHLRKRRQDLYTQLKIDEISNLGAAKIRIRSMLAAVEEGRKLAEQQNA